MRLFTGLCTAAPSPAVLLHAVACLIPVQNPWTLFFRSSWSKATAYARFPAFRIRCRSRFRKKPSPYRPFMPLLLGRVRGNNAAGLGARAPSFPRKRVGGVPGAYERQIRKNRTRSYMNGNGELTETDKLRSSYGILTDERHSYVLCYDNVYGNGYGMLEIRH